MGQFRMAGSRFFLSCSQDRDEQISRNNLPAGRLHGRMKAHDSIAGLPEGRWSVTSGPF